MRGFFRKVKQVGVPLLVLSVLSLLLLHSFTFVDRGGAADTPVSVAKLLANFRELDDVKARLQRLEGQGTEASQLVRGFEYLKASHQKLEDRVSQLEAAVGKPQARESPAAAALPKPEERSWQPATASPSDSLAPGSSNCKIFVMWNYPTGPAMFIEKNLESWIYHSKGRCGHPILINESNIKEWIPDMPTEYWRMPYDACRSDIVRYALIYHHGGIYLDTDFLVVKDMAPVLDKLEDHDFISYSTREQSCEQGSFSSNFVGGRKGSVVMKEIWEAQKEAMVDHCDDKLRANDKKVCCSDDLTRQCHIPWAGIGENIAHPVLKRLVAPASSPKIKYYCFHGPEGFVPSNFLVILTKKPGLADALSYFKAVKEEKPMDRIMYHLFASQGFGANFDGPRLFDNRTVVGYLYRKSIGHFTQIPRDPLEDGPGKICASDGGTCHCHGKVFYGRRFMDDLGGKQANLESLLRRTHAVKEVNGEIECSAGIFGDPLFTTPKHCICQPRTT